MEKVHHFLDPPPQDTFTILNLGKKRFSKTPPPLDRNLEKFEM